MSRFWHESVAALGDLFPGGVPGLGGFLLGLTAVVAMLWYWWPDWLPGRRRARRAGSARSGRWWTRWRGWAARWRRPRPPGRLRRLRWPLRWLRWRRPARPVWTRRQRAADLAPDGLPDLPAAALALSADQLAAQGRYRDAVRERLRAIVRDLVDREVVPRRPGWTVTELAAAAGRARPATAEPLARASAIFSGIWYGQRPAGAADDAAMRRWAVRVREVLDEPAGTWTP